MNEQQRAFNLEEVDEKCLRLSFYHKLVFSPEAMDLIKHLK